MVVLHHHESVDCVPEETTLVLLCPDPLFDPPFRLASPSSDPSRPDEKTVFIEHIDVPPYASSREDAMMTLASPTSLSIVLGLIGLTADSW